MAVATALAINMRQRLACVFVLLLLPLSALAALQVVVIEGLGGEERYAERFAEQVDAIERAASGLTSADRIKVFRSGEFNRDAVLEFFASLNGRMRADDRLAVFLVGHGSYDEFEYKFNIAGPDLTGTDLAGMLEGVAGGSQLLVNTSSSSGAALEKLKHDNRTVILATRSGVERHATRFGTYFTAALSDESADLDKNRIITAEEAYRFAERQVADYFERNGQLATEHPRIDGTQAGRFGLARLGAAVAERSDSQLGRLTARRDALNAAIEELRLRREAMTADAYQAELLNRMLELATVEEDIESREQELADAE